MPKYAKRSKSRRGGLPAPIAAIARSATRQYKRSKLIGEIQEAAQFFHPENNRAERNVNMAYDYNAARGRGAYKFGKALRKFGAGKFGQAIQGAATNAAISGMGMYTGAGEYEGVEDNDILNGGGTDIVPVFEAAPAADEGVVISRREYVSEIYGPPLSGGIPQPFVLQKFPVNPGLESTFPWLSQIASNYDEYELKQLVFTFKSTTTESSNTTNGQVGTIIMVTNYNAAAPVFTDKVTMLTYAHANSGRITSNIRHWVECDPAKLSGSEGQYVRNNPVVTGQDLKTYDHGTFQIAVANCASTYANVSLGELWVSYTVVLRKPKFYTSLGLGISKDLFLTSGTGETLTQPFGTLANLLKGQQNNIGCRITFPAAGLTLVTFPAAYRGTLKLMFVIGPPIVTATGLLGTYTQVQLSTLSITGNVTPLADLYGNSTGDAASGEAPPNDTAVSSIRCLNLLQGMIVLLHVSVDIATNGIDNSITFGTTLAAAAGTVPSQSYLDISEYNSGFSYAATGLGTSAAPVMVNQSGVIVTP